MKTIGSNWNQTQTRVYTIMFLQCISRHFCSASLFKFLASITKRCRNTTNTNSPHRLCIVFPLPFGYFVPHSAETISNRACALKQLEFAPHQNQHTHTHTLPKSFRVCAYSVRNWGTLCLHVFDCGMKHLGPFVVHEAYNCNINNASRAAALFARPLDWKKRQGTHKNATWTYIMYVYFVFAICPNHVHSIDNDGTNDLLR